MFTKNDVALHKAVNGDLVPLTDAERQAIADEWNASQPTAAQIIATYSAAGQTLLDSVARAWQYNDIASVVTYVGSSVPKFAAEAQALTAWRDAFWWAAEQLMASIQAGTEPLPATPADFLTLMPAAPARPI